MRVFIAALLLIFSLQSWTKADDLRDFEIEGMSIGDSLLDYFSEDYIKNKMNEKNSFWYEDDTYVAIAIRDSKYEIYEDVGIVIKPNDRNYIIHSVEGTFNYGDNIKECYKKQKIISKDLKKVFGSKTEIKYWDTKYSADKSGKSTVKYINFYFKEGSVIRVVCFDMSKDFYDPNDQLYVVINSIEFSDWLKKIAN